MARKGRGVRLRKVLLREFLGARFVAPGTVKKVAGESFKEDTEHQGHFPGGCRWGVVSM